MDRRIYLAFALAILVLVLNSVIFSPKEKPQQLRPVASGDSTLAMPFTPTMQAPEPPKARARLPAAPGLYDPTAEASDEDIVRVETDLIEAEFDPVGGTLRSWKLKRYTDAAEEVADLVRSRELGALWFALRTGERVLRTDSTRFRTSVVRSPDETQVRFIAHDTTGISLQKTFTIPRDRYDCRLDISVAGFGGNEAGSSWEIGWIDGMPMLERIPKSDEMTISTVALFGKDYRRVGAQGGGFGCSRGGGKGTKTEIQEGMLRWFGVRNKYFLGALILDEASDRRIISTYDGDETSAGVLLSEPISYGDRAEAGYNLYLGPIHYGTLSSYGVDLERVQDLGPSVLRPFSKLLMKFFEALNKVIPNYGFEILILSILVRVIFWPLSKKSMSSMRQMQLLKPEMDRINEKYKDDAERKNKEVMGLYKKKKINPLGGCLPLLVQLPVLSGLYYVLSNAIQLRKEPFILWMQDLSAPDTVGHLAGFPINIMPLIMAVTMFWQQKITPTDPRQKTIGYMMPIFMTFLFYSMSSGLVFYWTISNLLTVLQQIRMYRTMPKPEAVPVEDPPPRRSKKKSKRR